MFPTIVHATYCWLHLLAGLYYIGVSIPNGRSPVCSVTGRLVAICHQPLEDDCHCLTPQSVPKGPKGPKGELVVKIGALKGRNAIDRWWTDISLLVVVFPILLSLRIEGASRDVLCTKRIAQNDSVHSLPSYVALIQIQHQGTCSTMPMKEFNALCNDHFQIAAKSVLPFLRLDCLPKVIQYDRLTDITCSVSSFHEAQRNPTTESQPIWWSSIKTFHKSLTTCTI